MRELWQARHLVRTLAERELRARYKQAFFGWVWALATPVAFTVVFTIFFRRFARFPTGEVPYPVFTYVGLIPWSFFSSSVATGGQSLLANNALLNKVYCPREVFPLSNMAVSGVDSLMATVGLAVMFAIYGVAPAVTTVWAPLILAVQVAFALGVALVISAAVVYVRDVRHALSIILQLGLFATPVVYPLETVPRWAWRLYSACNPLAPVIDSYRRTILYGRPPRWDLLGIGACTAFALLVLGYLFFKRLETGLADVA